MILEEWSGFGKVDFSSSWDQSVRRSTNKKKYRNHENNKKTQEETPKNHFIIAFGNRTNAGDTVHLQPRWLEKRLWRVTLVLLTSKSEVETFHFGVKSSTFDLQKHLYCSFYKMWRHGNKIMERLSRKNHETTCTIF